MTEPWGSSGQNVLSLEDADFSKVKISMGTKVKFKGIKSNFSWK